MAGRLEWDAINERVYETGTDRGVLFVMNDNGTGYESGVAWNGLTGVTESPSGAEETALWADNLKYLSIRSAEEFGGTIEAYMYPNEFMECDGSKILAPGIIIGQQSRKKFAFAYRTIVGNDTKNNDYGEKLHVIYGCSCSPSERAYSTVNDSPEAITFSWEFTTASQQFTFNNKTYTTSSLTFDLTGVEDAKKEAIYDILWGHTGTEGSGSTDPSTDPTLPDIGSLVAQVSEILDGE